MIRTNALAVFNRSLQRSRWKTLCISTENGGVQSKQDKHRTTQRPHQLIGLFLAEFAPCRAEFSGALATSGLVLLVAQIACRR